MISPERNAEIRRVVRGYLAERPRAAQTAKTIAQLLRGEHSFTAEEVADAARFLRDLGHVRPVEKPGDAQTYWQVTAAGTLEWEREQLDG